jgi:hypothetical protein
MTLCPIALVVGCKKCPAFAICPLKSVIGDYKSEVMRNSTIRSSASVMDAPLWDPTEAIAGLGRGVRTHPS